MGFCWVSNCMNESTQRCSGCKTATYCSAACQQGNWSAHKKECKMQRMIYDMEQEQKKKEKAKPAQKPRKTHCTGCGGKFDGEDLEVDQKCPDCGYITCESCSCDNSNGSCYCQNSNFGYKYCSQEPRNYHWGKEGSYKGDYHPTQTDGYELNAVDHPEAFKKTPRACNNCGEVVRCLKKEYRNWA